MIGIEIPLQTFSESNMTFGIEEITSNNGATGNIIQIGFISESARELFVDVSTGVFNVGDEIYGRKASAVIESQEDTGLTIDNQSGVPVTFSTGDTLQGVSSGASAVVTQENYNVIEINNQTGTFTEGEELIINGGAPSNVFITNITIQLIAKQIVKVNDPLKLTSRFLDLYPDTKISFKLNNPLFGDNDFIPGEYSLPFDIPLTDRNVQLLNNPDVLNNRLKKRKYTGIRLWYDGLQLKTGTLTLTENAPGKKVSADFKFGLSSTAELLKSTSLRDICTDVINLFDPSSYQKKAYLKIWDSVQVGAVLRLSINGTEFTTTLQASETDTYNTLRSAINADSAFSASVVSSGAFGAVTQLQVMPAADADDLQTEFHITDLTGLYVRPNYDDQYDLFNDVAKDYLEENTAPDDRIRFPRFYNDGFYPAFTARDVNKRSVTGFAAMNDAYIARDRSCVVPMVSLNYIMDKLAIFTGVSLAGDFLTSDYCLKNYFFNTYTLNIAVPFVHEGIDVIFFKSEITLSDHLPDIQLSDLLKALKSRFALNITYQEATNTLQLNFIKDVLANNTYKDITPKAGKIRSVDFSQADAVQLSADQGSQDTIAGTDTLSYGDNPEMTITTRVGSIMNMTNNMPRVSQEEAEPKDLKFVSFDQDVSEYAQRQRLEDLEDLLIPYLRMLVNGEEVKCDVRYTLNDILNLNWEEKQRIYQVNYLVKSIDVSFTMQSIEPAKVVLVSV